MIFSIVNEMYSQCKKCHGTRFICGLQQVITLPFLPIVSETSDINSDSDSEGSKEERVLNGYERHGVKGVDNLLLPFS